MRAGRPPPATPPPRRSRWARAAPARRSSPSATPRRPRRRRLLNLEPVHGPPRARTPPAAPRTRAARCAVGIEHPVAGVRGRAVAARAAGVTVVLRDGDPTRDEGSRASVPGGQPRVAVPPRHRPPVFGVQVRHDAGREDRDDARAQRVGHGARGEAGGLGGAREIRRGRGRSDGGRDNPNLTTRREDGHRPAPRRLSRTMDLPGGRRKLRSRHRRRGRRRRASGTSIRGRRRGRTSGTRPRSSRRRPARGPGSRPLRARREIIEFDEPAGVVSEYLATRGFLQVFWECGGGLAAPALRDGAIHRVMAFVAPKMIGCSGGPAPSPVGETGADEMTDATQLRGLEMSTHGRDVLIAGYVPAAGTTGRLKRAARPGSEKEETPDPWAEDPLVEVEAAAAARARTRGGARRRGGERAVRAFTSRGTRTGRCPTSPRTRSKRRGCGAVRTATRTPRPGDRAVADGGALLPGAKIQRRTRPRRGTRRAHPARQGSGGRGADRENAAARLPELVRADWDDVKRDVRARRFSRSSRRTPRRGLCCSPRATRRSWRTPRTTPSGDAGETERGGTSSERCSCRFGTNTSRTGGGERASLRGEAGRGAEGERSILSGGKTVFRRSARHPSPRASRHSIPSAPSPSSSSPPAPVLRLPSWMLCISRRSAFASCFAGLAKSSNRAQHASASR